MKFKPQAYKTISNSHGMEIMVIDADDCTIETELLVQYRYTDEGPDAKIHIAEVCQDYDDDLYFKEVKGPNDSQSSIHYLNEFLKITII